VSKNGNTISNDPPKNFRQTQSMRSVGALKMMQMVRLYRNSDIKLTDKLIEK
jgi:hypothetical protein